MMVIMLFLNLRRVEGFLWADGPAFKLLLLQIFTTSEFSFLPLLDYYFDVEWVV